MVHSRFGRPLPWRFSMLALLLIAVASMLLQSQPVARAAGPARPQPAAFTPSEATGVMPAWFKPSIIEGDLLERVKQRRTARGDVKGAARVATLRKWFSLFGLYRGLPALGMDLFRHRGLATELAQDWTLLMERFAASSPAKGPGLVSRGAGAELPELLAINQAAVLEWVRLSLRKARKAFKGGAVSRLLQDVYTEVTSDPHFVTDVLEEADELGYQARATVTVSGDGWVPEQLTALAQQVFEIAREELFPEKPRGGFFSYFGWGPRQAQAPGPGVGGAGKEL